MALELASVIRSDIRPKEDIFALGRLENGLELCRFHYRGSDRAPEALYAAARRPLLPHITLRLIVDARMHPGNASQIALYRHDLAETC
jgi:hypothetical protein